jgi:hypothetical protein
MRILSFILTLSMMTSAAFGSASQSSAERMNEVFKLQRELGKLETQIQYLKQKIDSDKSTRNMTLVVSAALLATAGRVIYKADKARNIGDMGLALVFGAVAVPGAVTLAGTGAYKQYQINLTGEQLDVLQVRLQKIQMHLDAKAEEIQNSER